MSRYDNLDLVTSREFRIEAPLVDTEVPRNAVGKLMLYLNFISKATNLEEVTQLDNLNRLLHPMNCTRLTAKETTDLVRIVSTLGLGSLGGKVIFLKNHVCRNEVALCRIPTIEHSSTGGGTWLNRKILHGEEELEIYYEILCTEKWYFEYYAEPLAEFRPLIHQLLADGDLTVSPLKGPYEQEQMPWRRMVEKVSMSLLRAAFFAYVSSETVVRFFMWSFGDRTRHLQD